LKTKGFIVLSPPLNWIVVFFINKESKTMKIRYRLFKRGQFYYSEDAQTGKQQSLKTSNRTEAQRLVAAKNEAINNAQFTLAIGQTYLAITDAQILTRTWKEVMDVVAIRGGSSTQNRCLRAFRAPVFERIKKKPILQTTASDFLTMLTDRKSSTRHYLKLLHGAAFELGWLAGRTILTRKAWTPVVPKPKRAITWDEHCKIIASEQSRERQLFYEMLWETGASQTDASRFSSANVDWTNNTFVYCRAKTGQQATIAIGERLQSILEELPEEGFFFPSLIKKSSTDRAAEFNRRCKVVETGGISLHSYRYAWAERAFRAGYPERFAQAAFDRVHFSVPVHELVLGPS
jgi:integrase